MSAGGYMGPVGPGFQLGAGGLGLPVGNLGHALIEGARSVFGNEQVAEGFRTLFGGLRGGTPIDPLPGEPGFGPGPGGLGAVPGRLGMQPDWDANAWRPAANLHDAPLSPLDRARGASPLGQGLAEIASGMGKAARNGAIFSGVVSLAINGYKVIKGQLRAGDAAGSVVADTAGGAVSGATGGLASGLALALAGAAGLTAGLPLTLFGIAAGLGGAIAGNWLFKRTGLYDGIRNGVARLFGGSAHGSSGGWQAPWPAPGNSGPALPGNSGSWPYGYGSPGSPGGLVPVNSNLGRPVPMH